MSSVVIPKLVHLTVDEIYRAILAKERDYATHLYAQLEGLSLANATRIMAVIYRVFYIGYEDCLRHISIDDMPGFENNVHKDAWLVGFRYALKLPTFKSKSGFSDQIPVLV
jgi:hypothetical protein